MKASHIVACAGAVGAVVGLQPRSGIGGNSTGVGRWPQGARQNASADAMLQLSADQDFHFELLRTLGLAPYESADVAEVLVAAQQIRPGDMEIYHDAFFKLATGVGAAARAMDAQRHAVSARNAFFRAASYYRSADFYLHGNWSDARIDSLWAAQLAAFDAAIALLPVPGDNLTIPAIFFAARPDGKPRPTLLVCNGYDGSQEEMLHVVGLAALQHGINVVTLEGPGQPTVRRAQGRGFMPEWERVVGPVVMYARTRREVDGGAIGLLGYSVGGLLAPRAAAMMETRLAAVLAVDGLYDFGRAVVDLLPELLAALFQAGDASRFNEVMQAVLASDMTPTALRWAVQQGIWSFKATTPFDWLSRATSYSLDGLTHKLTMPVFVADAAGDSFFPGQARELARRLGRRATYHRFRAEDGAGEHCSVGASVLQNQVLLDWFEDVVSGADAVREGGSGRGDDESSSPPRKVTGGG